MPATTPEPATQPATLLPALPSLPEQAENLIDLGVPALAGLSPAQVRAIADDATAAGASGTKTAGAAGASGTETAGAAVAAGAAGTPLLVLPGAAVTSLAPLMVREDKPGFVVQDLTDVEQFSPLEGVQVPARPYLAHELDRGDELRNASPEEALAEFTRAGRTPLTLLEGIFWVLAQPQALEPNRCFMTIASRRRKPDGRMDARTPALWISGGTGRDGRHRKGAPKVGWCWWRNRHTWLGIASAAGRTPLG